jgi:hypothetical protein
MRVVSNGDKVRYTFYHPTFQEFFTAIHLLDLNREDLLHLYIKEHRRGLLLNQLKNHWLFYFGLMGAHYRDSVSAILRYTALYERMRHQTRHLIHDGFFFMSKKLAGQVRNTKGYWILREL